MEARGILLNVYLCRHKGFVDEGGQFVVRKGFSLQPNAASSPGCGAEINQERPAGFFCFFKGSLDIFSPLHGHVSHLLANSSS